MGREQEGMAELHLMPSHVKAQENTRAKIPRSSRYFKCCNANETYLKLVLPWTRYSIKERDASHQFISSSEAVECFHYSNILT